VRRLFVSWLLVLSTCAACGQGSAANDPSRGPVVTLVGINVLHGAMCPPDTDNCQVGDRVALLAQWIERVGCPDMVALQEVAPWVRARLTDAQPRLCGGRYRFATKGSDALDAEEMLTLLPIAGVERIRLVGPQRTALWVRVRTRVGLVDAVVTHLGAGGDSHGQGGLSCTQELCPRSCVSGSPMITCQVRQSIQLLERHRQPGGLGLLVGDFNLVAGAEGYRRVISAAMIDTYLASRHSDCDAASALGCTSGRPDTSVAALRNPASGETERVDYVFLRRGHCRPQYDTAHRLDTGLFADEPVTNGPGGLAWPSDHVGVALDLACA
jgi:endonuclease/exonuclease/phosphatase family metal-dependent hydrolase